MRFKWDDAKAASNKKKHGVSFEEAVTVFCDEFARIIYDHKHSDDEDRFILLGVSTTPHLIVVCHCYRENDEVIRIVSARKATKPEAVQYREFRK